MKGTTGMSRVDDLIAGECMRVRLPSGTIMSRDLGEGSRGPEVDDDGRLTLGATDLAAKAAAAGLGLAYVEGRETEPFLTDGWLVQGLADRTPPFEGEALTYPQQRILRPRSAPSSM